MNGPKYQLVRESIDWEQFTWRPTLKGLAGTREYRLTRWKGIRVGHSPDKSIGKTLSTGEWIDLILGRVRLEDVRRWGTRKYGTGSDDIRVMKRVSLRVITSNNS
jgi:hypothetical protein